MLNWLKSLNLMGNNTKVELEMTTDKDEKTYGFQLDGKRIEYKTSKTQ